MLLAVRRWDFTYGSQQLLHDFRIGLQTVVRERFPCQFVERIVQIEATNRVFALITLSDVAFAELCFRIRQFPQQIFDQLALFGTAYVRIHGGSFWPLTILQHWKAKCS